MKVQAQGPGPRLGGVVAAERLRQAVVTAAAAWVGGENCRWHSRRWDHHWDPCRWNFQCRRDYQSLLLAFQLPPLRHGSAAAKLPPRAAQLAAGGEVAGRRGTAAAVLAGRREVCFEVPALLQGERYPQLRLAFALELLGAVRLWMPFAIVSALQVPPSHLHPARGACAFLHGRE